ncbi:MAG: GAF domain-containing protein [Candidatus Eisenbacteria bacterium]|nr:GAF domain-containing protein [Candidatus Eisenbacteria bacterium]
MATRTNKKEQKYLRLLLHLERLIGNETDLVSIMAAVACEVYHSFKDFNWVGFYRVTEKDLLKIGPYQGEHGCLAIPFDRGICGAAARKKTTQSVADVSKIPHHIACSPKTKSEIVVPLLRGRKVIGVLDIDSHKFSAFDSVDRKYLEMICEMVAERAGGNAAAQLT